MSTTARLTGFAAVAALAFGGAAVAGGAIDPDRGGGTGAKPAGTHGSEAKKDEHGSGKADHGASGSAGAKTGDHPVRGLAVAEDGLRLAVDTPDLDRGKRAPLRFRVVDERGRTVRDFDVAHEKRMHLILARRDLTGFQHLHPRHARDGSWTTDVTLPEAGSYRLFADFTRDDEPMTLASDLRVDGAADLRPLPAPATTAKTDDGEYDVAPERGGDVALERDGDELRYTITRGGTAIHTEPYLGAGGHLVALREGDLAFLHVHPSEHGDDDGHDDSVGFEATFPTAGRYRLFLQFKHEGRVHTVAFTQEVK